MKASKFLFFVAVVVAMLAGCETINPDNTPDDPENPDNPFVPEPNTSGNVGPRANTYDDPENGIYVSPNGNDATADGSIGKPYKSINEALTKAGAGGTVILRGGKYDQPQKSEVRIRYPNVTIKSAKGEWAHINLPFPTPIGDQNDGNSAVRFDPEAAGSKLQCVEVTGGFYTVCFNTKWDWGQPDRSGASNIIIEDCILHDSRYEAVKVKPLCNNITIRYCEIYNPARAEVGSSKWNAGEAHAEAIDNVNAHNMKVQNCYMHDVNVALYAKGGAKNVLIENNRIENCLGAGITIAFDTSPAFFDIVDNPRYYECKETIVRNNLIINTGWEGIGFYAAENAQVYNNTIINAMSLGPKLNRGAIYFGTVTQDWANPDGCPATINPKIHHNIIVQSSTVSNRMIDIRGTLTIMLNEPYNYNFDIYSLSGKPVMNNNCYYAAGKSATFRDNRPESKLNDGAFEQWKSHIGGDSGSLEVDPALDEDYMPANAQCSEMGIPFPLKH